MGGLLRAQPEPAKGLVSTTSSVAVKRFLDAVEQCRHINVAGPPQRVQHPKERVTDFIIVGRGQCLAHQGHRRNVSLEYQGGRGFLDHGCVIGCEKAPRRVWIHERILPAMR
jgi:hypothetical protein